MHYARSSVKRSVDKNNCENLKLVSKNKNEGESKGKHLPTAQIAHFEQY